jgi:adenylate cyclase
MARDFQTLSRTPETMTATETLARKAVALDASDAEARSLLCVTLWAHGDYEGALAEAERALAMSPNLAVAHHVFGTTLIFSGRPKEGVAALDKEHQARPA